MRTFCIFLLLLVCGCNQVTPQQFVDYVNNPENGFVKVQKADKYTFKVQYLPPDYIALQYLIPSIETNFEKTKEQADSSLHFKLTICLEDSIPTDIKSDLYKQKVKYLTNDFIENCILITDRDTILPIIHHYETNPNIRPCENVMFAFENTKNLKPEKIIIIAPLYSKKPLEFEVQEIKRLKIPTIKL